MIITYNLAIFLAIFALLGLISIFNWRKGFFLFLIYIFFEDAIRMKLFHNNVVVQIAKDLLLIGVYIGCFIEKSHEFKLFRFIPPILFLIAFETFNIFNPENISLTMGFAALKLSFFYFPIIWIAIIYFKNPLNLKIYLLVSFIIVSIICTIAFIQTITGPDWWWDFFGNYETLTKYSYHTWTEEAVFRPFGIFNNSGRFMQLLFINYFYFLLCFTLQNLILSPLSKKIFWLFSIPYFMGFIYSISRTSFAILVAVTLFYIFQMKGLTSKELFKVITLNRLSFVIIILLIFFISSNIFRENVKNTIEFLYKSVIPGHKEFEVSKRIDGAIWSFQYAVDKSGFFGHGTGINSLGLVHILGEKFTMKVESGYAAVIWEQGLIGLALWLYIWITILRFLFSMYRQSKVFFLLNSNFLSILMIISFLISFLGGFQTFQSWIFNILFWNFIGIIISLNLNYEKYLNKDSKNNT